MKILIVDDNEELLESTKILLQLYDFNVVGCGTNGKEAIELYEKYVPDLVLLDYDMPNYDGIFAINNIRKINPNAKAIFLTAKTDNMTVNKLRACNPTGFWSKPYPPERMIEEINKIKIQIIAK